MNVHLTFDVEVWCNGWDSLDASFPGSFERYVYGGSKHGQYALPMTLEILNRHGLKGVFFVEPLFAARFGIEHLATIVKLIQDAGQEVQLHLHPEWTDEIRPPLIENSSRKRQHLVYYDLHEQTTLIGVGRAMLEQAGSKPVSAFRAGSFAANLDTFEALRLNQILIDSSLNSRYAISGAELRATHALMQPFSINGVRTFPVTVFRDGFGRERPAHVGACSFAEMKAALESAKVEGLSHFVVVSHNFEMLKPGSSAPSWIVVKRFERLCAYLSEHRSDLPTGGYPNAPEGGSDSGNDSGQSLRAPSATLASTAYRYAEQIFSRLT